MVGHRFVVPRTWVQFPVVAQKVKKRLRGEMDITLGFGPSVPGSSPGEGTLKVNFQQVYLINKELTHLT